MGYGMQFEPRQSGPIVTKIFHGGEAHRTGLIQEGDLLVEINNVPIREQNFCYRSRACIPPAMLHSSSDLMEPQEPNPTTPRLLFCGRGRGLHGGHGLDRQHQNMQLHLYFRDYAVMPIGLCRWDEMRADRLLGRDQAQSVFAAAFEAIS